MARAQYLPASATKRHNSLAAFASYLFLLLVVESIPEWIQVEATSESPNRSPSVIRDVGKENIVPPFSAKDVELWQFEINNGFAVILWDEVGRKKFPPSHKYKKTIN